MRAWLRLSVLSVLGCGMSLRRLSGRQTRTAASTRLLWRRFGSGTDADADLNGIDTLNVDARRWSVKKLRQHVNPLSEKYQQVLKRPEQWMAQAFKDPSKPLHVDIGSARGGFCVAYAALHEDINVLGLEIRDALVVSANRRRREVGLDNCFFLFSNANVDTRNICGEVADFAKIRSFSIQFPDPHFKKRNHKRRVVQKELVDTVVDALQEGGFVFLQGDVFEVVVDMRQKFAEHPDLEDTLFSKDELSEWIYDEDIDETRVDRWLPENPLQVPTDRERLVISEGSPVYRCLLEKKPKKSS